jgi:hypothetical protein
MRTINSGSKFRVPVCTKTAAGAILLALLLLACTRSGIARNLAAVSIDVQPLGPVIPRDFDGFSIEVDDAAQKYLGTAAAPNPVFYQLLKNLGAGTIRIGGDSTDYSCWDPAHAPHPDECRYTITDSAIRGYFKASQATGWPLIIGINLAQNDAAWALEYGRELIRVSRLFPGARLMAFEFGNEPDLFSTETRARPPGYSWRDLVKDWKGYIRAFKTDPLTSRVALAGPAFDDASSRWKDRDLAPFIDSAGRSNLGLVTVHEYPTDTCNGDTVTIPELLAANLVRAYRRRAAGWVSAVSARRLSIELGETNSTACAGRRGVDDVFASSLWALDWLFTNAQLGFRRINFHMDGAAYSAVWVKTNRRSSPTAYWNTINPLYYAMYAFTRAESRHLISTRVSSEANVTAFAASSCTGCAITLFIMNKDVTASGEINIRLSRRMGRASVVLLRAPSLRSRSVTYGDQSFDPNSGLIGRPKSQVIAPGRQGNYSVHLPTAAAAIVEIQPRASAASASPSGRTRLLDRSALYPLSFTP